MSLSPEEQARIDLAVENTDLYWLSVIAQLAHTQAATAEVAAMVTRTSKSEKVRQANICETYIHVLETRQIKGRPYTPESALKRLREAVALLGPREEKRAPGG